MAERAIYLDYNATALPRPEVRAAVEAALQLPLNPSSVHKYGRKARNIVETARAEVAALAGAESAEVLFTSGGTEANNLALGLPEARSLVVSAVEHDSVLAPARERAAREGVPLALVSVRPDGQIDLEALEAALAAAPRPALFGLMAANNETGVVQPLAAAVALARAAGAFVFVDAVQAAGKIPLDFAATGAHMMSLSGHKIGGPTGTGALIVRGDLPFQARQTGGGQELGRRAGTENVPGIAGFGAAAARALHEIRHGLIRSEARDRLEQLIKAAAPEAVVYGAGAPRLPNTTCIGMPGVEAEIQVMAMDLEGIAISAGAACSSGKVRPSHVLLAMGADPAAARQAVRFSFGWNSATGDADAAAAAWVRLWLRRRGGMVAR